MGATGKVAAVAVALLLAACQREERRFDDPAGDKRVMSRPAADLFPGDAAPATMPSAAAPAENPYARNAWGLSQGEKFYRWFNCNGCHSNGGGGIGPALMDGTWIYGGDAASVYQSIVAGRPNGMPSFRDRLTEQQAWQLVTYVHYLAGNVRPDMVPGRSDGMNKGSSPTPDDTRPKAKPHGGDK
jgi:cytochrome c oxidase cbb3-type subunit III